jgi:hypothetical protein
MPTWCKKDNAVLEISPLKKGEGHLALRLGVGGFVWLGVWACHLEWVSVGVLNGRFDIWWSPKIVRVTTVILCAIKKGGYGARGYRMGTEIQQCKVNSTIYRNWSLIS